MIQNLKVTDGDMLILNFHEDVSQLFINKVTDKLKAWLLSKGFQNVEIMVTSASGGFNITKVTVNDVFEQEVLKGANNG